MLARIVTITESTQTVEFAMNLEAFQTRNFVTVSRFKRFGGEIAFEISHSSQRFSAITEARELTEWAMTLAYCATLSVDGFKEWVARIHLPENHIFTV